MAAATESLNLPELSGSCSSARTVARNALATSSNELSMRLMEFRRSRKTVAKASIKRTQATAPACQSVKRTRTESSIGFLPGLSRIFGFGGRLFVGRKNVPSAAPRVQQGFTRRCIDFAADAIDVDFDEIRERIELFVPNVLGDFGASNDASGIAREKFKERVFLCGKRHRLPGARNVLADGINNKIGNDD